MLVILLFTATEIKYSTDKLMSNIILISSKQEQTDKDVTDLQAHGNYV